MTVKELKTMLADAVDILEQYDDEDKIKLVSNTYFLGHPNAFIGIAGYNGGYVALDYLEENILLNNEEEE